MIRGPVNALKFKDYILPLVFLKRLSNVFDDEIDHLAYEFSDRQTAATFVEQDHQLVRFYIPEKARWSTIAGITIGLGQALTDAVRAVARKNLRLFSVLDVTDFNATTAGPCIGGDRRLAALDKVLNHHFYRLGLDDVEPDILGRADEYLPRKVAEGQGQSAGEFYVPRDVAVVMARLLDSQVAYSNRFHNDGHRDLQVDCVLANLPFNDSDWHGELLKDHKRWVYRVLGHDLIRAWREAKNDSEVLYG